MQIKNRFEGIISITSKGTGYIKNDLFKEDIEIDFRHLKTALPQDKVEYMLLPQKKGERQTGEIIRIVERNKEYFTGSIERQGNLFFLKNDDYKIYTKFLIDKKDLNDAKPKDKVYTFLYPWKNSKELPKAKVVKILGKEGEHEAEIKAITLSSGFELSLGKKIEEEAKKIKQKGIEQNEYKKRKDFRRITTFTIDPKDAKDFDDALSFRKINDDEFEVGIHIADVTHYVKENTKIEEEAKKRTTSVYLVDRTIPMLPEILSNDLCSLVPEKDRLVFSVILQINKKAHIKNVDFTEGIIKSKKRFTYEEAEKTIKDPKAFLHEELKTLNEIAKTLAKERYQNGAVLFEKEEVFFILDQNKKPIKIEKKENLESHKLIEEFMLLANKKVAEFFKNKKEIPFVYRIHDLPNQEKMEQIHNLLNALGYHTKIEKGIIPNKEINRLMNEIKDKNLKNMINFLLIRSMAKAIYSTKNIGHYGLQFKDYTHFTSPIRRYPDMLVHRILKDALNIEKIKIKKREVYEKLCLNSSEKEKRASDAERASKKFKQVEFMANKIGQKYDGVITGMNEWGLFVEEKETKCEGMIRAKDMEDDFYTFDEKRLILIGKRHKKMFKLGSELKIKVKSVDLEKKTIDYVLG